ncbi:MAG: hypothetical protein ACREV0_04340, partial [Burkholderiales bacterium]
HLGNYYGALRQFIHLQNDGEALYFIANLHALTTVRDAAALRDVTLETALAYLSLGLDPKKAILFRRSDIAEIIELYWILGTVVPFSHLERAHGYKDKIARGISAGFGLFAYPVLMAADILTFGSDMVPVGKDQIQGNQTARTRVFDIVRGYAWPQSYTGRALRNRFMDRWDGRESDLAIALKTERPAYQASAREGDYDTAVVWAGEAVDLIKGVESAAALVVRISAEAEAQLHMGAKLARLMCAP